MTNVHFVLNGKGGIGKSFISSLLCQYLTHKNEKGESVVAIDTDPNNTTLYNMKALKAKFLQLIDKDGKFDVPLWGTFEHHDSTHWFEVIGNIYEHEYLLKD